MPEKPFEIIPKENLEPVCDVCGGLHKTSNHGESLLGKTELLNPICEICGGSHKTSQHHDKEVFFEKEKDYHKDLKDLNKPEFKGMDGEEYPDRLSMERANEAWTRKTNSYKGLDGQYYEDKFDMEEANRRFTEQMNPKREKDY